MKRTLAMITMLVVALLPAAPAATAAPEVSPQYTCYYTVMADFVYVKSDPGYAGVVLKYKFTGDRVTGPCFEVSKDGLKWSAVFCSCDTDGLAWMGSRWLRLDAAY